MSNIWLSSLIQIYIHKYKYNDSIVFEKQKTDDINYLELNVRRVSLLFNS